MRTITGATLAECENQLLPNERIIHTSGSRVTGSVTCKVRSVNDCDVCEYPLTDGACGNPVCGGGEDARKRFRQVRERRAVEDAEHERARELRRQSFTRAY